MASFIESSGDTENRRRSAMEKAFLIFRGRRAIATIIAVVFAIVSLVASVIYLQVKLKKKECKFQLADSEHGRRPCPPDWIWYQMKCYYFSNEEGNWTAGQDFCSLYNASLAIIGKEEMKFVLRYKGSTSHWIGLKRDPNQRWKWIDGNDSTLKVIGDGGGCAFLNDDATASCSRCHTAHHWICSKPDEFRSPKIV